MDSTGKIQVKRPSGMLVIGNSYCVMFHGEIYITIGPDWPFNIGVLTAIIGALICFIYIMAKETSVFLQYFGFFTLLIMLISYLLAAFKDPGIIISPWEIEMEEGSANSNGICKICQVIMEPNSHHCTDCQVCIRGHDHHCPFTGKGIGSGNIIPFYVFLTSIFLGIVYFGFWIYVKAKITQESLKPQ